MNEIENLIQEIFALHYKYYHDSEGITIDYNRATSMWWVGDNNFDEVIDSGTLKGALEDYKELLIERNKNYGN